MIRSDHNTVWYDKVLDIVFPRRCAVCGDICIPNGQLVCGTCKDRPIRITEPRCKKCSKPIASEALEFCYDCTKKDFHYKRGISLWLYDEVMKQSIVRYKYKGGKEYTGYYAGEVVKYLGKEIKEIEPDVLLPVPVHRTRQKQRGYNQAELLAREIGRLLNIMVLPDALIRTIKTLPQKELSNIERMRNLERAFAVSKKYEKTISKFHKLMLIDDIYTTGSTIEACTKVLQKAGAEDVYFLTLCIGEGY